MHEPYEYRYKHKADFRVKYRFRDLEEGGRPSGIPYQGIRCDFSIEGQSDNEQYQIWPEFEDEFGEVILNKEIRLPKQGTARMWIVRVEMRPIHYDIIKIGLKCFFREGRIYSADCEVIELLDLKKNPSQN